MREGMIFLCTRPETNRSIAPENRWFEYYFPIGVPAYFQGRAVSFREGRG